MADRLVSSPPQGFEQARVVLLMDVQAKRWDVDIIRQLLLPYEAELVINMSFPNVDMPDRPAWKLTTSGNFEVSSAYSLAAKMEQERDPSARPSGQPRGLWEQIWGWKLPRKVRHFLWRVYTDTLPTGNNMVKREMAIHSMCFFCGAEGEGAMHIFQQCQYMAEVNAHLNMPTFLRVFVCTKDLLEYAVGACDQELLYRWLVSLWDIWHQRNKALRDGDIRQPPEVVEFAGEYLAKVDRAAALVNEEICIE